MKPMQPKLSFCIATFNRASFLAATLESIIAQATSDCEIVVSDNASTDDTESVVAQYARRFDRLKYHKQDTNTGIDRNFDRAVELATGEYCWLMPDDDVVKPGAVTTVLQATRRDPSLIVANVEFMDFTLSHVRQRGVDFQEDRVYESEDIERLFADASKLNGYIGSFVIKREVWMARDRQRYFGSEFIHIGVIYQQPLPGKTLLIAQPLVGMRMGNTHTWWAKQFDIIVNTQKLWASLALPEIKKKFGAPWKHLRSLLWLRALGAYSIQQYRRQIHPKMRSIGEMLPRASIALLPIFLVHAIFVLYFRVTRRSWHGYSPDWYLQILSESRLHHRSRSAPPQSRAHSS